MSSSDAYALCRAITHKHGANFSVGFRFLPTVKRRAVYAAYAFCRWADDIADDPGTDIASRLDAWERELDSCYAQQPRHAITIALADALQHFAIPKSAFRALIEGCRQDMTKSRYQTFDELLHYCDLVASSISDISLSIFGHRTGQAPRYGRNLSTALQLTNVTRDIGDDLERDRIYVPADEMERFEVTESDLVQRRETENVRQLILFQVDRAEQYFRAAEPLLEELSFDSRFPTLLMGSVYSTVLRRIRRNPFAPLHRRVALSFPAKISVVAGRLLNPRFV
ncbi:MAG: phytoene/squalene synthase family protein [Thermoanaerobaculia bacterium]